MSTALRDDDVLKVFVFNVHQLISPGRKTVARFARRTRTSGTPSTTIWRRQTTSWSSRTNITCTTGTRPRFQGNPRPNPLALVGLTATPAESRPAERRFPVHAWRGYRRWARKSAGHRLPQGRHEDERTQLQDACTLLRQKEAAYTEYESVTRDASKVRPVLFVVAASIEHATEVGQVLAGEGFIGDASAVLGITSESSDVALAALAAVESPDSAIRAIVSSTS